MGHESRYFDATDKAKEFVKNHIAIDFLMAPVDQGWPREDMWEEYHGRAWDAGIDLIGLTAATGPENFDAAATNVSRHLNHIYGGPDRFTLVRTTHDLEQAHDSGKAGLFFNAQGCECLNNNPDKYMPVLKSMGFGTMMFAYNERYRAGDGCMVNNADKITLYGHKVIDAMHRNRVAVDLSHASEPTALSAIEYSQKVAPETPVVYTHGIPDAICDYVRSSTDAEIEACAANGGVFTLTMLPWLMVSPTGPGAQETKPDQVVEALEYIKNLVGINYIGLSSDDTYSWPTVWEWALTVPEMYQDGGITMQAAKECPVGAAEPAKIYPAIVDGLWAKDYSDDDIAKILGGNIKRVLQQVWG